MKKYICLMLLGLLQTNLSSAQYRFTQKLSHSYFLGLESVPPKDPTIYETYPERFLYEDIEESILSGKDVPAELLHVTKDELRLSWTKWLAEPKQALFDAHQVFQFNLRAAELWQELVNCQPRPLREEKAREAFGKGENFCGEDDKHDEIWKKKLTKLHVDLFTFLATTYVQSEEFHQKLRIPLSRHAKNAQEYNSLPQILPRLHPLFVQVLFNVFVLTYPFPKHFAFSKSDWGFFDELGNLGKKILLGLGIVVKDFNDIIDQKRYDKHLFFKKLTSMLKNEQKRTPLSERERRDLGIEEARVRVVYNIVFLISHFPIGNCTQWGLWPGLMGAMSFGVSDRDFYDDPSFPAGLMHVKHALSCGHPPLRKDIWNDLYVDQKFTGFFHGLHSFDSYNVSPAVNFLEVNTQVIDWLREMALNYWGQ